MGYGRSVGVEHSDLLPRHSRLVGDFGECAVGVVEVEQVVVAGMVVVGEYAKVVVKQVADVDVKPAVVVDVGAGDAGG